MSRPDAPSVPLPEAPRRAAWWAALAYLIATFSVAWPALIGRFLLNPHSDQYIAGYAFREFAAASFKSGQGFPLWNPYLFGGLPYVAAMHGDIFYPTFLLRMILPTDVAMTWGFVIHLFIAGMATYAFLRVAGVRFHGALVGGLAYLLAGPIAGYASPGHDGKLFVSALFPLTLTLVHLGIRNGRRWAFGALALTIGLAVLSPHPQLLEYLLLGGGAYAFFVAFGANDAGVKLGSKTAWTRVGGAIGAAVVGGAMGAIQFLPVAEYVAWSPRAKGMLGGYEHATSYSMPPEELINTFLPQFSGILNAYWGRNGIHLHSEYLGIAVLVLAGAAFYRGQGRRAFMWFFAIMGVVSMLWALGGYTPFYQLIYALVPGTKFFRAPSTMMFIMSFSVAVLAAIGVERVLERRVRMTYLLAWATFGVVLVLMSAAGGFTNIANSVMGGARTDMILNNAPVVTFGALRSFAFLLIVLAAIMLFLRNQLTAGITVAALAACVGLDLWTVERKYWMFTDRASVIYGSDATIEYLKKIPQPGRVLALWMGQEVERDAFLSGDALMTHRVRQILGYHGNSIGRYDLLRGANDGNKPLGNPNFWALTNLRYLLTDSPTPVFPNMKLVAGPVRDAAGSMVYLFEMPGDNPAAWVTPAIVKAADDAVLTTVLDPRFNVRTVALFDTSESAVQGVQVKALPVPLDNPVTVSTWEPGHITMTLAKPAPAGAALMVSENYYPGWQATVDGKPAPTGRADLVLIGVALPAGAKQVELTFRSATYQTGKTVTTLATIFAVLLLGAGLVADRRARSG